jgi:hypothetical protein
MERLQHRVIEHALFISFHLIYFIAKPNAANGVSIYLPMIIRT